MELLDKQHLDKQKHLKMQLNYQKYMRRDYNFEFNHLASLYFIDKKKEGYFNREDLLEFTGMFVQFKIKNEYDYLRKFQAYASTEFWKTLQESQGQYQITEWMLRLFKESRGIKMFSGSKEVFFTSANIKEIYQVLRVEDFSGSTVDEFMRLFQKVAEDSGQIELGDSQFDDVVPAMVVAEFFRYFLDECYSYLQNILSTTSTKL
ncbi:hypothetical protein CL6EHI_022840 [Entamoeba histolytica]|uniref:Uncharacterized protein n=1 Tax=Entamoeba histolytica TaxID=5759 RepID=A0A175JFP3_ENTHI|nr:hypothetical protein CL6EHI_022840 [Entamoeba histolytica]